MFLVTHFVYIFICINSLIYFIFHYKQKIFDELSDEDSHVNGDLNKFFVGCDLIKLELLWSFMMKDIWRAFIASKRNLGSFVGILFLECFLILFYQRADLSALCSTSNF